MRPHVPIAAAVALISVFSRANALTDLRASLAQLPATAPLRGLFEISSTIRSNEEAQDDVGKATVRFEVSEAGLRILYPHSMLAQANQEARSEAVDPDRQTPTRSGVRHIRPLHLAELLDAAAALSVTLESAQLMETKSANYGGRSARLLMMKLTPKLSKGSAKHVKKLDITFSVWLADDGVPLAAEQITSTKASFLLISFQNEQKESWTFTRVGDRLVTTRFEETQKADGLGQHESSQTTEVVTVEP